MATGKLKMWNADRGFGFIAQEGGTEDVFLHITRLLGSGIDPDDLQKGDRLVYEIGRCTFLNTPPKFLLPASDNVGSSVKHRTDISGLHDLIFGGCLKRRNTCSQISTWTPKRC